MFTATTFFVSISQICARPQDTQSQIEDLTKDLAVNLNDNADTSIVPPTPEFTLSSTNGSPPSSKGIPDLAFHASEIPVTLPQTIPKFNAPFGVSTEYTNPETPNYDGLFNSDPQADLKISDADPKSFNIKTDAVKSSINSITQGSFTFGVFGVSGDRRSLVPVYLSNAKDWKSFAYYVRDSRPVFALHSLRDGLLLIDTYQHGREDLAKQDEAYILDDNLKDFWFFVEKTSGQQVYTEQVWDESSLELAIDSHIPNHEEPFYFDP